MPLKTISETLVFIKKIKDFFFIVTIIISISGWIYSTGVNKTNIENHNKVLTEHIDKINDEISNINSYISEQRELNGKFKQFIDMNVKNKN